MRVFLICLLAASAIAYERNENDATKTHTRRGAWANDPVPNVEVAANEGYAANGYSAGYSDAGISNGYNSGYNGGLISGLEQGIIPVSQIVANNAAAAETVTKRLVPVPVSQPVEVTRAVPVRVPYPVPIEHRRPVEVRVPQPYPVPVIRHYLVPVDRAVPVPVPHAVRITYPRVAIPVPVPQPYIVPLQQNSGLTLANGNAASYSGLNYVNQAAGPLQQNSGLVLTNGNAALSSGLNYVNQAAGLGSYGVQNGIGYSSGSWSGASYPGLRTYAESEHNAAALAAAAAAAQAHKKW